jgi:hypothetical protein
MARMLKFFVKRNDAPLTYEEKLVRGIRALELRRSAGGGGKHILIACMPKSASTFLFNCISSLPGFSRAELTVLGGRREQELSVYKCALVHHLHYVAQNHVRYSEATQIIMTTFDIFPVILTRNIFDCVVSLRDHFRKEGLESPIAYIPKEFLNLSAERQFDVIIDLAVPWYANFFACWADYKGPAFRASYDDIAKDPNKAILNITRNIDVECSATVVDSAIESARAAGSRFNKGESGRGKSLLSTSQIARIREIFSIYKNLDGVREILQ